jgi:hypothetical protein
MIGHVPGKPGVLSATGKDMLGLTLAPGNSAETTRQATTRSVPGNARPFSLERLARAWFS